MENLVELVRNMPISEELDERHIGVIASNEADGKEESNQLEVPLILNGSMLLERNKSKSDANIVGESQNLDHQMKFNLQV